MVVRMDLASKPGQISFRPDEIPKPTFRRGCIVQIDRIPTCCDTFILQPKFACKRMTNWFGRVFLFGWKSGLGCRTVRMSSWHLWAPYNINFGVVLTVAKTKLSEVVLHLLWVCLARPESQGSFESLPMRWKIYLLGMIGWVSLDKVPCDDPRSELEVEKSSSLVKAKEVNKSCWYMRNGSHCMSVFNPLT